MNIKFILIVLLVLLFTQLNTYAQQQGFGCIYDMELLSFSGIEKNTKIAKKPIVDVPPLFGKKARKSGRDLSLPFGIGLYSLLYDQGYTANNLLLIPDSSTLVARADSLYQNISAHESILQIRPNVWLFPFLNVYGIIGYSKGVISPNLVIPYIVIENIPIIDSIIIDSTFEIHDEIPYVGLNYGIGATFSMGFRSFFVMVDYNYTITDPTDLDENLHAHLFSPKVGILLGTKSSESFGAIWLGAMYMHNDQSFSGKIDVADINPDLVFLLGEKATYSGNISAKQRWNFIIGSSWVINNHHHIVFEVGFWERKQISIGYDFRF
jgi:hypothetical protein